MFTTVACGHRKFEMNIEIDYEVASNVANEVLLENYKLLVDGYSDVDEGLEELLKAFRVVIRYSVPEHQLVGVVL